MEDTGAGARHFGPLPRAATRVADGRGARIDPEIGVDGRSRARHPANRVNRLRSRRRSKEPRLLELGQLACRVARTAGHLAATRGDNWERQGVGDAKEG